MNWRFRLLFDGDCPMCRREVAWLKRRDRHGNLDLENIASPDFNPSRYGLSLPEANRVLHGVRPDGTVAKGMDAVHEAYRAVGLGWVLAPTRLPGLRQASDLLYGLFARNRVALGGLIEPRCRDASCGAASRNGLPKGG